MTILALRAQQSTNTTGTGTLTLNAAASSRRSFQTAFGGSARRIKYVISTTSGFELGYGDYDGGSPGTLTRVTVIASSNAGSLVSLPAGTADVFTWLDPGERGVITGTGALTLALADLGNTVVWSGTVGATAALPAYATVPEGMGFMWRNGGTSALTIDPSGAELINGAATLALAPGQAVETLRIGSGWVAFFEGAPLIGSFQWGGWSTLQPRCLWANGQNVSRTIYAALFATYGTTYGAGDGSTTFGLPDLRGRTLFGKDDMGGSAASRVTTAGSSVDGLTLGAVGGSQSLHAHTHTVNDAGHGHNISDAGHSHSVSAVQSPSSTPGSGIAGGTGWTFAATGTTAAATTGVTVVSATTGITVASAGAGASQNMPPALIANCQIYAGV